MWQRLTRHIKDGIGAEAEVLGIRATRSMAVKSAHADAEHVIELLVHLPGGASPVRASYVGRVPADCVPVVGERLPVTVSAAHPTRLVVLWDWVPPRAMAAAAAAELERRGIPAD